MSDFSNKNYEHAAQFEVYLLTERCLANNTVLAYSRDIRGLLVFLEGILVSLEKVTPVELKLFLRYLYDQRLSARTISRKISAVKLFFGYLSERSAGWANIPNPTHELQFPKLEKRLPQYLSEQEIQSVFRLVDKDEGTHALRNRAMFYLLYVTGMRVSELTGLRRQDFQLDQGLVQVLGKGGKQRSIPLVPGVIQLIRDYIDSVPHEARGEDYLFPVTYAGILRPISRQSLWMIIRDICQRARIKRSVSPHHLRHSLATHMLKNGVNLRSLQLILGHENLSTVQIYTHVETSYLRTVYDKKHPRS